MAEYKEVVTREELLRGIAELEAGNYIMVTTEQMDAVEREPDPKKQLEMLKEIERTGTYRNHKLVIQ